MGSRNTRWPRKSAQAPPQRVQLSIEQVRAAIPQLERRLTDLKAIDVEKLSETNVHDVVSDLQRRIDDTLVNIFGHDTVDYHRYSVTYIDETPISLGGEGYSIGERRQYIARGLASAVSTLEFAISMMKERLEDSGETAAARAIRAYQGLELHSEIARAASKLYHDGHYATAVEHSVKALNDLVRSRSTLELDGVKLMQRAMGGDNPLIKFNDLAGQSDKDEQTGFMMLFSGAVSGLRNPRAHGFLHDAPERALEFIAFVSLLAKLLEEAK